MNKMWLLVLVALVGGVFIGYFVERSRATATMEAYKLSVSREMEQAKMESDKMMEDAKMKSEAEAMMKVSITPTGEVMMKKPSGVMTK